MTNRPAVSIVIICQDDAARLPDSIQSATNQDLANVEVIVVDHGSTDESPDVAEKFAAADSRVRVIRLPDREGKPGRPLNVGFAAAKAPWVVAIGSDDEVRPAGCSALLEAGENANADLVIGGVLRVDMATGVTSRWMPKVTLRTRVVTDFAQLPEMLRDTIGGSKLYRKEFLERHDIRFREDIFYQDQIFTARCYEAAQTVAITSHLVTNWRRWSTSDRKSITQRKSTVENLSDRFEANREIDEVLAKRGRQDMLMAKHQKFLTHDLGIHVKDLDQASDEYRDLLVALTRDYMATIPEAAFEGIPLSRWLMLQCLLSNRLSEAEQMATSNFNRLLVEGQLFRTENDDYLVPRNLPLSPDNSCAVTRYRLPEIPTGLLPVRGWASLTPDSLGFVAEVTVDSPGRSDMDEAGAAELLLRNSRDGQEFLQPLTSYSQHGNQRVWRTHISQKSLDRTFGRGEVELNIYASFNHSQPAYWRVQLRPLTEHEPMNQSGSDSWVVRHTEGWVQLYRQVPPGLRERALRQIDRVRYRNVTTRDPYEELTLSQAADYLSDHRNRPRADRIFFESFAGRRIDGASWGLSQALRRHRPRLVQSWSGNHGAIFSRPAGTLAAPRFTRKYVDLLASSGTWVDNGWLPFNPEGRTFLQLGHGVPLSKIPAPDKTPFWTHLVTSGEYTTMRLREVYGPALTLLSSGSPATDPLLAPDARERRATLRSRWGVADRTVLLYLPALRSRQISPAFRLPDLQRLASELGSDYYLFFREHDNDATGRRTAGVPDDLLWFANGLRQRGQLADYLLAADILVSDYSSFIVDFGWTGRPVIHYAPDQDFYENDDLGTYLKLDQLAAGPVVGNDEQLIQAIREAATRIDPNPTRSNSRRFSEELAPLDALSSGEEIIRLMGW